MHTIAEIGTNVPAFLGKLWKMVEDPITNDLITWSSSGTSFVIKDEIRFARELLPMYYKHNNMASFIRQLNMYGFHKIVSPEAGSMKLESDEIQFSHPFFVRGHAYLLDNIKRKIGMSKMLPEQLEGKAPQVLTKVLTDVRQMKGRQESMDSRLTAMKLENGALWRELSVLRQKHIKQQQIVNKLIQFLVTLVQQNHNSFSVKRKFPRMLQHHGEPSGKHLHASVADDRAINSDSPSGPIIHELDPAEAFLETVVEQNGPVSPSDVTNYFLDPTIEEGSEEVVVDVDPTEPSQETPLEDMNTETIIRIPEDSLLTNSIEKRRASPRATNGNCSRTSATAFAQNKMKAKAEMKPKLIRIVRKMPKKVEAQPDVQQTQTQQTSHDIEQQIKNNLQKQIKVHQQQIEINQEQIKNQKKLQKNNQQLKRSRQQQQQQQIHNNQQQIQRTQQQIQRTQHQIQRNQQQQIERQRELQRNEQQQLQNNQLEGLLIPKTELPGQTDTVITIPLDNGDECTGLADVGPLYAEPVPPAVDYSVPLLVEVPSTEAQPTPSHTYTSDLLLGSPLVLADPVMTPSSEPLASPSLSPSAGAASRSDMQVACVDDTKVTSPNVVTRSALLGDLDSHLDTVQSDLDNLRELLRSEGISLDANTLLGYFNDDPLSFNISDSLGGDDPNRPKENSGSELMAYSNPSLFDFTDLLNTEWSPPPSPGGAAPADDSFTELNTPQYVPPSPSFPQSAKKRKK